MCIEKIGVKLSYRIVFFGYILLVIILSGCSDTNQSSQVIDTGGSIAFSVQWPNPENAAHGLKTSRILGSDDNCTILGIDIVEIGLYNSSDEYIAGDTFPCSDGNGTITDVPIGTDMKMISSSSRRPPKIVLYP